MYALSVGKVVLAKIEGRQGEEIVAAVRFRPWPAIRAVCRQFVGPLEVQKQRRHYCHLSRYQNPSFAAGSIAVSLPRVQVGASRLGAWYAAAELGSFRPILVLGLVEVWKCECGVHLRPDQRDAIIRMELELE